MIPFLVADRPASLRIIKGAACTGVVGLMSHANASPYFRRLYKDYPCGEDPCHALDPTGATDCPFEHDASRCAIARDIRARTVKMCDCGMFTKEGAQHSHEDLFDTYDEMGVDYGIMKDVFQHSAATMANAREAVNAYAHAKRGFELVLVAQGQTVDQYVRCYQQLRDLGGRYIAVGGLLQRKVRSARYVRVRSEGFMTDVISAIRDRFHPRWLFALGCYHPTRHGTLTDLHVWGSDHKGWIFAYRKRERLLQESWKRICDCLKGDCLHERSSLVGEFMSSVEERSAALRRHERAEYHTSRRSLRLEDRSELFSDIDGHLIDVLQQVRSCCSLNGAGPAIEHEVHLIRRLSRMTEQQIRFEQVRGALAEMHWPTPEV